MKKYIKTGNHQAVNQHPICTNKDTKYRTSSDDNYETFKYTSKFPSYSFLIRVFPTALRAAKCELSKCTKNERLVYQSCDVWGAEK